MRQHLKKPLKIVAQTMFCANNVLLHLSNLEFRIIIKSLSSPSDAHVYINLSFEK